MDDVKKEVTTQTPDAAKDAEDLKALANKPIKIKIGEGEFNMRRMSVDDALQLEDERERLVKEGVGINRSAMISMLFLLSLLLQPEVNFSVDQLKEKVLFEDMGYVMEKLKEAGFKQPQVAKTNEAESQKTS